MSYFPLTALLTYLQLSVLLLCQTAQALAIAFLLYAASKTVMETFR